MMKDLARFDKKVKNAPMPRHCDDYIGDHREPSVLRFFLLMNRLPAVEIALCREFGVEPKLFADYKGERVRVVMASRLGDVGIVKMVDYTKGNPGYRMRVAVEELSNFSDQPPQKKVKYNGQRKASAHVEREVTSDKAEREVTSEAEYEANIDAGVKSTNAYIRELSSAEKVEIMASYKAGIKKSAAECGAEITRFMKAAGFDIEPVEKAPECEHWYWPILFASHNCAACGALWRPNLVVEVK